MNVKINEFLDNFLTNENDFHGNDNITNILIIKNLYTKNIIQIQFEDRFDVSPIKHKYIYVFWKCNSGKFIPTYLKCSHDEIISETNDARIVETLYNLYEDKLLDTLEQFELINYE